MTMAADKQDKVLNVPNLRFPEFSGEWGKYKVSDVLDFYSTNSLSWDQLDYNSDELLNLHYGLIHVGLPTVVNLDENVLPNIKKEFLPKNYELCREGDVAFADASEDTNEVAKAIEFVNLSDKNVVCGLHTIHGRDNHNLTSIGFKGYSFASESFHNQIRRIAQGTKIFSISSKNFNECYMGIPSKDEQTKIAKLLALIDERISTQSRIIDKLQSLMKGLNDYLQDFVPLSYSLSFSDIGEDYSGLSGKSAEDFGSGKPYITYVSIYANNFVEDDCCGKVSVKRNEKQNVVQKGDMLFTLSSETPEEVCYGAVYSGNSTETYLNSFCFGIRNTEGKVFSPYMAYFFNSNRFRREVYPLAQGSTRFNLQKSDFLQKHFSYPSIDDQHRIFEILNAYDNKLKVENQILVHYQHQKEFLLRNLFI